MLLLRRGEHADEAGGRRSSHTKGQELAARPWEGLAAARRVEARWPGRRAVVVRTGVGGLERHLPQAAVGAESGASAGLGCERHGGAALMQGQVAAYQGWGRRRAEVLTTGEEGRVEDRV